MFFIQKSSDPNATKAWYSKQIDIMILEFLMRSGHYELCLQLQKDKHLEDHSDLDLFITKVKPVVDGLMRGDCTEASKWLVYNQSRLKKMNIESISEFEVEIKIQEFVQLLKQGGTWDAIQFAQNNLSQYASETSPFADRIKSVMGFVVIMHLPGSSALKDFTGDSRMLFLSQLFLKVFFDMYNLPIESMLSIGIKAGICALKTPYVSFRYYNL